MTFTVLKELEKSGESIKSNIDLIYWINSTYSTLQNYFAEEYNKHELLKTNHLKFIELIDKDENELKINIEKYIEFAN